MVGICDANNFYVSCERVFNPALNGRPAVVLSNNDRCIIARSNEAKAIGLKMGQPIYQVRDTLRTYNVALCSPNFPLYQDMSDRMQAILKRFAPTIVYSIDEAFLDFRGFDPDKLDALGHTISRTVRHSNGLPVSIGIAPTKTLAKIASKLCKKYPKLNGCCLMHKAEDIEKVLKKFPVGDVWGIGPRYEKMLNAAGVNTAYDFTQMPPQWVRKKMSVVGLRTWKELRGEPCIEIDEIAPDKQHICTSRSFPSEVSDFDMLHTAVASFTATCAEKLRRQKSVCGELYVFIYTDWHKEQSQSFERRIVKLVTPTDSTLELTAMAAAALRQIYKSGFGYKKAGVILGDISPRTGIQVSLFDPIDRGKHSRLMSVMDDLNRKQGRGTVGVAAGRHKLLETVHEHLSRQFTTDINDILKVKAEK